MRLHAVHLSAARAAVLLAAFAGPVSTQEGTPGVLSEQEQNTVFVATASIIDGLSQVAAMPVMDRPPGSDLCEVVRGDALVPVVWSPETPHAASLFLWAQFEDGSIKMGSGTVVAGSDHGRGNRVLSAAHVFEHEEGMSLSRVLAFGQDGVLLASLYPVAQGAVLPVGPDQTVQEVRQDWAVLEPVELLGVEPSEWRAMGAPLASWVPVDAMVVGQPEGTSLIAPGASGGAVFDASGAVLGVLIQAFPSGRPPRVSRGAPFAQSLFWQPTGDMAFDGFAGQNFVMKLLDGLREDVGNAGLAIPVMGGARVALAGSVPDILDVEKVVGTMTVFPDGECRTGRVVAYPRVEADRMLGRVDETTVVPVTAQRAWAQLQGTGWYPSEPQDRVIWQALIGLEKSGFPVPAKSVLDLLGKAKWVEGRIGLEATRIEAGLHAGLRQEGYRQANHKGGAEGMMLLKEDFPSRNGRDPAMR